MIDIAQEFLIDLINALPFLIPFVLVMNLIASLLWGKNG